MECSPDYLHTAGYFPESSHQDWWKLHEAASSFGESMFIRSVYRIVWFYGSRGDDRAFMAALVVVVSCVLFFVAFEV